MLDVSRRQEASTMLPEDILRTPGDASELKFAWDLGFTSRFPDDVRADTASASAGDIIKVRHHLSWEHLLPAS